VAPIVSAEMAGYGHETRNGREIALAAPGGRRGVDADRLLVGTGDGALGRRIVKLRLDDGIDEEGRASSRG